MTDTLTSMYLMDTFADLAIALFSDATADREVVDGYIDNLTREIFTLQEAGQAKSELIHALKRFIDDHAPSSSKANRSDYFVSIPTEDFYSLVQAYKRYDLYDIR